MSKRAPLGVNETSCLLSTPTSRPSFRTKSQAVTWVLLAAVTAGLVAGCSDDIGGLSTGRGRSAGARGSNFRDNPADRDESDDGSDGVIDDSYAGDSTSSASGPSDLPPSSADSSAIIAADVAKSGGGAGTVYATLGHLTGTGTNLDVIRFGLSKTLNSVSFKPTIVRPTPVDSAKSVYKFTLAQYGLKQADWNRVTSAEQAGQNVSTVSGASVVKADWLVFAMTRPEVYDAIMHLPPTIPMLKSALGLQSTSSLFVKVQNSNVTFADRLLERIPLDNGGKPGGYYWQSYDFARRDVQQRAFEDPNVAKNAAIPDLVAGEFIFSLPNGLQGYMLSGFGAQHRFDAQAFVATDRLRTQDGFSKCAGGASNCGLVINGESCITCHEGGMKLPGRSVGTVGGSDADAQAAFNADTKRFRDAVAELGFPNASGEPIFNTIAAFKKRTNFTDARKQKGEVEAVTASTGGGAGSLRVR